MSLDIVFAKCIVDANSQNLQKHLDTLFDKIAFLARARVFVAPYHPHLLNLLPKHLGQEKHLDVIRGDLPPGRGTGATKDAHLGKNLVG